MAAFQDHFSSLAADYDAFRPSYPAALIDAIVALAPARELAWDCGTGNGQAAHGVARHFARVIATDASAEQLARARPHPRIEYRRARAEDSGLAPGSTDLVTVAAAAHWFDHAAFHAEVARVLRPGGVLAAWTYNLVHVSDGVDRVALWFLGERVARYWPEGHQHVESNYATLPFPYPELTLPPFAIEADLDRNEFAGYVGTWSSVGRCRAAEGVDPLREFVLALQAEWPDARERRRAVWPIALRVGRAPWS